MWSLKLVLTDKSTSLTAAWWSACRTIYWQSGCPLGSVPMELLHFRINGKCLYFHGRVSLVDTTVVKLWWGLLAPSCHCHASVLGVLLSCDKLVNNWLKKLLRFLWFWSGRKSFFQLFWLQGCLNDHLTCTPQPRPLLVFGWYNRTQKDYGGFVLQVWLSVRLVTTGAALKPQQHHQRKEMWRVHTAYLIAGATKSSGTCMSHYKWRNCLGMQQLWWKKIKHSGQQWFRHSGRRWIK